MKTLCVQKPWAPFCCLSYCHWTCDVGSGNSFYSFYSRICFLKWEDSSQEAFLTKNELWILLTYDDAYVGIAMIISYISSAGSQALKLRILVSMCVCVCVCVCVCAHAQLCTLCDPTDCIWPGSSLHGISQAGILESVPIPFSRVSSRSKDWTHIFCPGRWILYH